MISSGLVTILMLVIFPLNSLLLVGGSGTKTSDSRDVATIFDGHDVENLGVVKGVSSSKENGSYLESRLPVSVYQPIRKDGYSDLNIPNAHSTIIIDVDSGMIMQNQNGRTRRQIASLTKMMTAVLVVEKSPNLDDVVTIEESDVAVDGTRVGCPRTGYCISERLRVGEQISVRNLLKAMLMNSANDAATALARHVGGSVDEFVKKMNRRAKELDLKDSNFCTPSGLEIDGEESKCYSTAHDIARIAAHSLNYDVIWEIMRYPNNTIITSVDGKYSHEILNTDILINQMPSCIGAKTGFTPLAGRSLLMAAQDSSKKHKIIAVILDDPYRWQDIQTMVDWSFSSHTWQ